MDFSGIQLLEHRPNYQRDRLAAIKAGTWFPTKSRKLGLDWSDREQVLAYHRARHGSGPFAFAT